MTATLKSKGAQIIGEESKHVEKKTEEVPKIKESKVDGNNSADKIEEINEWDVDPASLASGK